MECCSASAALGKSYESVQCAITGGKSAHASQAFSIAHCTDSEDFPIPAYTTFCLGSG